MAERERRDLSMKESDGGGGSGQQAVVEDQSITSSSIKDANGSFVRIVSNPAQLLQQISSSGSSGSSSSSSSQINNCGKLVQFSYADAAAFKQLDEVKSTAKSLMKLAASSAKGFFLFYTFVYRDRNYEIRKKPILTSDPDYKSISIVIVENCVINYNEALFKVVQLFIINFWRV